MSDSDSSDDVLCGLTDGDFMGVDTGSDDDDEEEEAPRLATPAVLPEKKPKYTPPSMPQAPPPAPYVSSWPTTGSSTEPKTDESSKEQVEEEMPTEGSLLSQRSTDHFADSVEFCPHVGSQDIVVCGTYQLDQSRGWRVGSLVSYQLNCAPVVAGSEASSSEASGGDMLEEVSIVEGSESILATSAGVLDIKWSHQKLADRSVIGMVASDGSLQCFELRAGVADEAHTDESTTPGAATRSRQGGSCLTQLASTPPLCADASSTSSTSGGSSGSNDTIFLSLDWNNRRAAGPATEVVVSDNKGGIGLWSFSDAGLRCTRRWSNVHSLDMHGAGDGEVCEVWITAFDCWHPQRFFSGGEDGTFKSWDARQASGSGSGMGSGGDSPVFVSREHSAGVCSIHSHPFR
jgi:hypothetical protein